MEITLICPCCGQKLIIAENGAVMFDRTIFDKEPEERLAQVLQAHGLEFGVTGGEQE